MASRKTSPAAPDRTRRGFEALFAMQHVQSQVVRLIDDALARGHGTNLTGFELLVRLARLHPEGASLRFLSDQVLLSPSRVSRVVDEFVGRGLIERTASPHDGRLSLVSLTPAGREALEGMEETFAAALDEHFLGRLSDEQVQALIDVARAFGAPNC